MHNPFISLFTAAKRFITQAVNLVVKLKRNAIDLPEETAKMTKAITKELDDIHQKIEKLNPHDDFDSSAPPSKPSGFKIVNNSLFFDPVEKVYYCYNCFLNRRWQTVSESALWKKCPHCNCATYAGDIPDV